MALSASNSTPDPKPTGDLEHLFRQKFADAEVTPRASVWEQLDHELLVQENNTYRRRLMGYRWAAAASLLLLASGGTWLTLHTLHDHQNGPLATTAGTPSAQPAPSAGTRPSLLARATAPAAHRASTAPEHMAAPAANPAASQAAADLAAAGSSMAGPAASFDTGEAHGFAALHDLRRLGLNRSRFGSAPNAPETAFGTSSATYAAATATSATGAGYAGMAVRPASLPAAWTAAGRPDVLPTVAVAPAAPALAALPEADEAAEETAPSKPRRWKFAGSYGASAFQPNINFSQASMGVSAQADASAVPSSSYDAYEVAAAEYRRQLRSGPGQRVTVTAEYGLGRHWSVQAGLQAAQLEATSETSWYFQDGKSAAASFYEAPRVGAANYVRQAPLRTVSYRYRTAGVPVSVRYATTEKQGWSLYAKLGAAVNVLLGSRTELQGVPEATRVYTLASPDSPYRKVLTTLHAGAGVRFRPADASWSLALGPDAEAGLTSLNADPAQGLLRQARPYAVGLEASVEFGGKPAAAVK